MLTENQEVALMAAYLTSDLSHQCLRVMFKFHEVCIGCYGDESLRRKALGYDPQSTNDDLIWLQYLSARTIDMSVWFQMNISALALGKE